MCGGFTCSKNALIALNILYIVRKSCCLFTHGVVIDCEFVVVFPLQLVAFVLIGVAVYGRAASLVTNLPIIGGILACGILLILISMLGLAGAVKHHQVMLFFVSFYAFAKIGERLFNFFLNVT